jgi:hypothetical protein
LFGHMNYALLCERHLQKDCRIKAQLSYSAFILWFMTDE